jgi:hypothetical protein
MIIIGVLVLAVLINFLMKQQQKGKGIATWPKIAQLIDGTVETDGVSGTHDGHKVKVTIKLQDNLLMANPFEAGFVRQELSGWVYRVTAMLPPKVGAAGYTISYDGRHTTSTGASEAFMDRFRQNSLELQFVRVGAGQLIYDGNSGILTLERYFPVRDVSPAAKSQGPVQPIPTRAQFRSELELLDGVALLG